MLLLGYLSLFVVIIIVAGLVTLSLFPAYFLVVDEVHGDRLMVQRLQPHAEFSYYYVHSVEQVPVVEYYRVSDDYYLYLDAVETSSLGAGLPYGEKQGNFIQSNGKFTWTKLNRPLSHLSIRPTVLTECGLRFRDQEINLQRDRFNGQLIQVKILKWSSPDLWGMANDRPGR